MGGWALGLGGDGSVPVVQGRRMAASAVFRDLAPEVVGVQVSAVSVVSVAEDDDGEDQGEEGFFSLRFLRPLRRPFVLFADFANLFCLFASSQIVDSRSRLKRAAEPCSPRD